MNNKISQYFALNKKAILFPVCFVLFNFKQKTFAQNYPPNPTFNNAHFKEVVITESVIASIGLIGLHYLWYKKFPHSRFHFFNDSREWLNMDKAGHATTAYNISCIQYNMMQWSGVRNNNAIWIGGVNRIRFSNHY